MSSIMLPHEVYRTLMVDIKLRLVNAERIIATKRSTTGIAALDVEFCFLQIRRIIEAITFGAIVREEARYKALRNIEKTTNPRDHGDSSKDWQAPEILKRLVNLSPHVLPIPIKEGRAFPGNMHFDRQDINVSHARLIDLYKRSGGFLHAKNPVGQDFAAQVEMEREKYATAHEEVKRELRFLRMLLWFHAAVILEYRGNDDPRTPANPSEAWIVNFGDNSSPNVSIILGAA